jgi:hypothetical protein
MWALTLTLTPETETEKLSHETLKRQRPEWKALDSINWKKKLKFYLKQREQFAVLRIRRVL